MNPKEVAGRKAAELVKDGMKIGLGTGSTAYFAIIAIGEKVRNGLRITATATSRQTETLAREQGIPLVSLPELDRLDLTIDGADELTSELHLIKGGGGALLREKMVALQSDRFVIIGGAGKHVKQLGAFPLPLEVVPFAHEITRNKLDALGIHPRLRTDEAGNPYLTDNHNYIYDCHIGIIEDPYKLNSTLKMLTGVVETGLFLGMASEAILGFEDGTTSIISPA